MVARSQNSYTYHCWFDQDFANEQTGALGNGQLLLDASEIGPGLHTLYVAIRFLPGFRYFVMLNSAATFESSL